MSQETPKEVKKLTGEDTPELANATEGTCCCYWKQTWTGWEKIRCTEEYGSEDDCRRNTPSGADAYSWSNSGC